MRPYVACRDAAVRLRAVGPSRLPDEGEAGVVERADIERIRNTHRPRLRWLACRLLTGCTCGASLWPCGALLAARDAECWA